MAAGRPPCGRATPERAVSGVTRPQGVEELGLRELMATTCHTSMKGITGEFSMRHF
jgi:hypothetical protein